MGYFLSDIIYESGPDAGCSCKMGGLIAFVLCEKRASPLDIIFQTLCSFPHLTGLYFTPSAVWLHGDMDLPFPQLPPLQSFDLFPGDFEILEDSPPKSLFDELAQLVAKSPTMSHLQLDLMPSVISVQGSVGLER